MWLVFVLESQEIHGVVVVVVGSRWLLLICMPECSTSSRLSSLNAELHVHSLRERQWSAAELGKIPNPLFSIFPKKDVQHVTRVKSVGVCFLVYKTGLVKHLRCFEGSKCNSFEGCRGGR